MNYTRTRQWAKQLAQQVLRDVPREESILLVFSSPEALVAASYATLEAQQQGIPYQLEANDCELLLQVMQNHQITTLWGDWELQEPLLNALHAQVSAFCPRLIFSDVSAGVSTIRE